VASAKGDLLEAAQLYQQCFALSKRIGAGVEVETTETISGLVNVRIELAQQLRKSEDFSAAKDQIDNALQADPKNPELLALQCPTTVRK
jgi:Tfp pilus assembly protein PilF